ncbi:MAG: hypothetical protein WD294_04555 [Phycisphaeraceae bacterium]
MVTKQMQRYVFLALATVAMGFPTAVSAQAEALQQRVDGEVWEAIQAEFRPRYEAVVSGPLGSRFNPVRARKVVGQRRYLGRLICLETGRVLERAQRLGSSGAHPYRTIKDRYRISCDPDADPEDEDAYRLVYIDLYHEHIEERPIPGFRIISNLIDTLERDQHGLYYEREPGVPGGGKTLADGVYENTHDGRVTARTTFEKGRFVAPVETFDEQGTLRSRHEVADGDRNGPLTWYDAEGEIIVQVMKAQGTDHGPALWFENGKVKQEGHYYRGIAVGEWTQYNADGEVVNTEFYDGFAEPRDDEEGEDG